MKKLVAILLILALPAMAYGASSLALKSGGADNKSIAKTALPTTMSLDIVLSFTDTKIFAVDGALDGNTLITVSAISLGSPQSGWLYRFDAANGVNIVGSALSDNYSYGAYTLTTTQANYAHTGTWATLTLNLPDLPVGDYPIGVVISTPGGDMISWASKDGSNTDEQEYDSVKGFTLHITPEPATILLLAGALPFLRRRTV